VIGTFFREQARCLASSGYQIGVLSPTRQPIKKIFESNSCQRGLSRENDQGVATFRLNYISIPLGLGGYQYRRWLSVGLDLFEEYVRQFGYPQLVHAQCLLSGGVLAEVIKRRHGIKYIVTEHSTQYDRNVLSGKERKLALNAAKHASGCFAVSRVFADSLSSYFGDQIRWSVLPNLLPRQFEHYNMDRPDKAGEVFTICSVSMLTRKKRIDLLIESFAAAFQDDNTVQLVIVGGGPERDNLVALARRLNVSSRVVFSGTIGNEKVFEQLKATDVLALSSDYETFGVVLIEAMALGKPVVATRCGGPETIVNESNGILVERGDVDEFTRALLRIRQQQTMFNAREIRARCVERYGKEAFLGRVGKIYNGVVNAR